MIAIKKKKKTIVQEVGVDDPRRCFPTLGFYNSWWLTMGEHCHAWTKITCALVSIPIKISASPALNRNLWALKRILTKCVHLRIDIQKCPFFPLPLLPPPLFKPFKNKQFIQNWHALRHYQLIDSDRFIKDSVGYEEIAGSPFITLKPCLKIWQPLLKQKAVFSSGKKSLHQW